MKSIFAAIVAVAASVVSAQYNVVSITSPLTGTVYTAGQPATITWIDQQVSVISKIVLAKGLPTALQPVTTIAQDVDANAGSYVWNVPADIAAGDDYALELGVSPNISYTGLFSIKNDNSADAAATAAATTTQAVVTAAASSSVDASSSFSCPPVSASASATPSVAAAVADSNVAQSGAFKVSSNKAAVGAIAVAGAAAAALI